MTIVTFLATAVAEGLLGQGRTFSDSTLCRGKLIHRKMTPAQVTDAKIDIGVIPYQGQYTAETGLRLGLSKWHSVIFDYDPNERKFVYKRIENN